MDTVRVRTTPPHAESGDQVLTRLGSSLERGLSDAEARTRLAEYGPNAIDARNTGSAWTILRRQVENPLVYVLLAAAALALAVGKTLDGAVVLGVVVVNTLMGFLQEYRAGRAIEALMEMVPDAATVTRDGHRTSVPTSDLVPGDVVHLEPGDQVPADLRLVAVRQLRIDEAPLTGESLPAEKAVESLDVHTALGDRSNVGFGGTLVTQGTATGVVVATGGTTELGRISAMVEQAVDLQTPLTQSMARIGKGLTAGILAVSAILLVVGLARGHQWVDAALAALTLAVAAIPEGLPAIITTALAIGVRRMAHRHAIVRTLPAVEALGSTTVVCSDKTGTLTRNEMTVTALWTPSTGTLAVGGVGWEPSGAISPAPAGPAASRIHDLLLAGTLCNDATVAQEPETGRWRVTGDPTEAALVVAARKVGLLEHDARRRLPRLDSLPFESERQFMATLHEGGVLYLKGAPEVVLSRCTGIERSAVLHAVEELGSKGMRTLGVAVRRLEPARVHVADADVHNGLEFLGLIGMIDPPRPEAIAAVGACRAAGIGVTMITGDHAATAAAIGRQIGILGEGDAAMTGAQLAEIGDADLPAVAERVRVFARVAPDQKLRLVTAFQSRGHVVAMTGDGVNDAPALKQANIGVAMGITGTDVSKAASDIVLADDNFASIVAAIEEGRRIYDNLIKSLVFVLPTNLGLALILMTAVIALPQVDGSPLMPMLPVQILWINLVATVALALPLAMETTEPDVMRRRPRRPDAPLLGGFVVARTVLVGLMMAGGAVGLFLYEYYLEVPRVGHVVALAEAQTMAVTTVVLFQVCYVLNCRALEQSIWRIGVLSNPWIFVGIVALLGLQTMFVYLPAMHALFGSASLNADAIVKSGLVAVTVLPVVGVEKALRRRWSR